VRDDDAAARHGLFQADNSAAQFGCNGWIKTPIEVAAAGRYTMEVVAGGTPCQGVYPHVEISVDGKKGGEVQLTAADFGPIRRHRAARGQHELLLRFTNDLNVGERTGTWLWTRLCSSGSRRT